MDKKLLLQAEIFQGYNTRVIAEAVKKDFHDQLSKCIESLTEGKVEEVEQVKQYLIQCSSADLSPIVKLADDLLELPAEVFAEYSGPSVASVEQDVGQLEVKYRQIIAYRNILQNRLQLRKELNTLMSDVDNVFS